MRRLTLRVIVALITFVIGVTAASLWLIFPRRSSVAVKLEVTTPPQTPVKRERTYERGPAREARDGSFITSYSSDGMNFTKWSVHCDTPRRVRREFEKRLKKVVEIISREPVLDEHGELLGEKVVAVFSPDDPDNSPASLLWTEKEELFQVEGSSLHDILEYRKDFGR